jgi:hypothetical protein
MFAQRPQVAAKNPGLAFEAFKLALAGVFGG